MRVSYSPSPNLYDNYYVNQVGRGLPVFIGRSQQTGSGLGGILRGIVRSAIPLLKSGGKQLLREGVGLVQDVLQGKDLKQAAKKRVAQTGKRVLKRTLQQAFLPQPPGIPITRKKRAKKTTRQRKTHKSDIFN